MAISFVAMATAALILFVDVVLELIEGKNFVLHIFLVLLSTVSVHYVFREIRRKDLI